MGITIKIQEKFSKEEKKNMILKDLEIININLILPLYNGKWENWGCKLEIEGYIFNENSGLLFNKWSISRNDANTPPKYTEQQIDVKIVNGAKVIKDYKIDRACIEYYKEELGNINGHPEFKVLFKFSKKDLKVLSEHLK